MEVMCLSLLLGAEFCKILDLGWLDLSSLAQINGLSSWIMEFILIMSKKYMVEELNTIYRIYSVRPTWLQHSACLCCLRMDL